MIEEFTRIGVIAPENIDGLDKAARKSGARLVFVDATFVLPDSGEDSRENFRQERLPLARFFDIGAVADQNAPWPHMLPDIEHFNRKMSEMGIENSDILVLYGQHGMTMGPARVWWMMRVFGHDRVLVLDGGLPAWKACDMPLETGVPDTYAPSQYRAAGFLSDKVADMDQVLRVCEGGECPILDARPKARYDGASPEPRPNMRAGHIPRSINLPANSIVDEQTGRMKSAEALRDLFIGCGLDLEAHGRQQVILSCGSGVTACVLALAMHRLGHDNFAVYDGSWSQWGHESSPTPVAKT